MFPDKQLVLQGVPLVELETPPTTICDLHTFVAVVNLSAHHFSSENCKEYSHYCSRRYYSQILLADTTRRYSNKRFRLTVNNQCLDIISGDIKFILDIGEHNLLGTFAHIHEAEMSHFLHILFVVQLCVRQMLDIFNHIHKFMFCSINMLT